MHAVQLNFQWPFIKKVKGVIFLGGSNEILRASRGVDEILHPRSGGGVLELTTFPSPEGVGSWNFLGPKGGGLTFSGPWGGIDDSKDDN